MAKRVLTVKEVADYLHVHQSTIYRMLKRSQLAGIQGRQRLAFQRRDDRSMEA